MPGIFIVIKEDNILMEKKKNGQPVSTSDLITIASAAPVPIKKVPLYESSDLWLYRTGSRQVEILKRKSILRN